MASEKTPNLGLNQIDRTSPKTTYFDLEKYLDQNWRAVDDFAGDVNNGMDTIKKRLDTTERKAVTLEPGVQIVHAEKASPFSLTGLSGRTLVNLLGRWGNLSSLTNITPYQSEIALDTTNKGTMPNSLKVAIKSGYTVGVGFYNAFKFLAGKYYVAIAKVKVGNSTNAGISAPNVQEGTTVTDKTKFTTSWFRAAPTSDVTSNIDLRIQGTQGQYSYFEAVRIYEISAADYTALASMTGEQIDAKYPYVDSVMPVRNPYVIRYGENMLPSIYEAENSATTGTKTIASPYVTTITKSTPGFSSYAWNLPATPGKAYTLSMKVLVTNIGGVIGAGGYYNIRALDAYGNYVGNPLDTGPYAVANGEVTLSQTFTTPTGTFGLRIIIGADTGVFGTFTFSEIKLNIGSMDKPFKPREDSMLALQTDLYADPVTGANADTVFERDGQYFKSKKWRGLALDGSLAWVYGDATAAGLKQVKVVGLVTGGIAASGMATKYDGKIIPQGTTGSVADTNAVTGAGDFYISIPLADSGWADSYTPTADEIKAYFMGWRMRDQVTTDPYTSGVKAWGSVKSGGTDYYTNTLPTTQALDYKTPNQLVYQLATPTVEPIISEGQLTFVEGDNQIETGTGIVLRESAKPLPYPNVAGRYMINYIGLAGYTNPLKNMPSKILSVYGNGFSEPYRWGNTAIDGGWYGNVYIDQLYAYAPEKSYAVTYLMSASSPIVPFVGSYAASEKTLLLDLVDSVQQNSSRVSALENKKADKDSPAWITPTLLNGWLNYDSVRRPLSYYKDSMGWVHVQGYLKGGTSTPGAVIFSFPEGYKPETPIEVNAISNSGTANTPSTLYVGSNNLQCNAEVKNAFLVIDFSYRAK
ncbi:hypothetical protein ASL14_05980 [Paenibacillus sp. IHB B 3084]|uniref:hypothetical protein n=1 Tax=Paenibacillus sp. IHB B 3084 TaxID=867076 RepID=UPI000722617C|nr:hypothetical protein [Paenibacillus sp. IHB B 3084]ALP35779.1 hypothetical protein ASL14_05980 [Paenibacillus sp. IHB B 3084]